MTHILPPHADLNIPQHSSISAALEMEQQQQQQHQQQQHQQQQQHNDPQQSQQSSSASGRKRKKAGVDNEDPPTPTEPRRLRRSHEACARCRSKKIKCDSKHPKCTACATAGTQCNQEDRHRQILTPRGHTDRLERQLAQCAVLLKRQYPNFNIDDIDNVLAREGIDFDASPTSASGPFHVGSEAASPGGSFPPRPDGAPPQPKGFQYPPPQHMVHPGYPHPISVPPYPNGAPYPPGFPPPGYNPHIHPAFQHGIPPPPRPSSGGEDIKGQDPQFNDMSNAQALAKNFGVSQQIVQDLKLAAAVAAETEDLAVGSGGLSSGRDRELTETAPPRNVANWITVTMQRNTFVASAAATVNIWLPKDRSMVKRIVHVYFTRLNYHRPVYNRVDFEQKLDALYDGLRVLHDPGYVCSLYLILALGTMCDLNKTAGDVKDEPSGSPTSFKKVLPMDWPEHGEFVERALAVKPDLRVTVSSLQALILLQWYLYTERQGRTLWRLVGSLVRLAIELGLHHDPTQQGLTFSEEECQLRIRLWGIVMVHDRGTSILLGRPLAIAPSDSNTPRPSRNKSGQLDFSEHFLYSGPMAEIQADIVNSLYSPMRQSKETIMRHATRIIKSMVEYRRQLPDAYKYYFGGTEDWSPERRTKLVEQITDDQGLTLLKLGISRILLLRALFSSKELPYAQKHKALVDAIITSHNIIVVHYQLIRFPDVGFFVSPIPLHIAAMVILYGHMSRCERLPPQVALEDIWMALDMLPRFRWRWERKDLNGGHPLILKLAEKVFDTNLHQVCRTGLPMLIPEMDWDMDSPIGSLTPNSAGHPQTTPTQTHATFPNGPHAHGRSGDNMGGSEGGGRHLADVPAGLFWPIDPQNLVGEQMRLGHPQSSQPPYQSIGMIGCEPSQDSYMLEEKDPSLTNAQMQRWMNAIDQQGLHALMHASQAAHISQGGVPLQTG
ncbi:hypothetical protein BD410DRAFT_784479 [Rickenella mellea]|uniref:Zn(2)-C6 fungal-type domain-containing protein n=1 Tax=Rickenella mellea TaxID=50990 RepID=A0A4Y7QE64_9AGAM|nr:hypothetical protein BD410DRAFT_784479 [Rickenella mellea]